MRLVFFSSNWKYFSHIAACGHISFPNRTAITNSRRKSIEILRIQAIYDLQTTLVQLPGNCVIHIQKLPDTLDTPTNHVAIQFCKRSSECLDHGRRNARACSALEEEAGGVAQRERQYHTIGAICLVQHQLLGRPGVYEDSRKDQRWQGQEIGDHSIEDAWRRRSFHPESGGHQLWAGSLFGKYKKYPHPRFQL